MAQILSMKPTLSILLFFSILFTQAQIRFEKGYFLDNSNNRVDCLIRNLDWKNNPTSFDYKLSEEGEILTADLNSANEFGFGEEFKFQKVTVDIDRSSDLVRLLKENSEPVFKTETFFIKVLVEGKASLYQYTEDNLIRYFYRLDEGEIQQLVYKRYLVDRNNIAKNEQYKRQIWKDLNCASISKEEVEKLEYLQRPLVRVFKQYNECQNANNQVFEKKNKGNINITIRPRINSSSATLNSPPNLGDEIDFGNKMIFGVGLEFEYVFPFNKNKWAVFAEGTYSVFKESVVSNVNDIMGRKLVVDLEYKTIDIPVGIRHYFFLNENSKLFIDLAYVVNVSNGGSKLS